MAGYHGFSMSNNAVAAYNDGLVPASKVPGVPAALVKAHCRPAEWHHASKAFNRVNFYDPAKVRAKFGLKFDPLENRYYDDDDFEPDPRAIRALAEYKKNRKCQPEVLTNCRVEWIEWSGSLNCPTATEMVAEGCTVSVKGQTATITLPSGKTLTKRLTTNGFYFRKIADPPENK